jgi:hypothetical protein
MWSFKTGGLSREVYSMIISLTLLIEASLSTSIIPLIYKIGIRLKSTATIHYGPQTFDKTQLEVMS